MKASFNIFEANRFTSWEEMCQSVATFVESVGQDNLITISQSTDHGNAVIIVWYWYKKKVSVKSKQKPI